MAAERKTTTARGYNGQHKQERARVKQLVEAGDAYCSRCGAWINPQQAWDLDHTDDRDGYQGPAHRRCNRRAGAIKGNVRRWGQRKPRRWAL